MEITICKKTNSNLNCDYKKYETYYYYILSYNKIKLYWVYINDIFSTFNEEDFKENFTYGLTTERLIKIKKLNELNGKQDNRL